MGMNWAGGPEMKAALMERHTETFAKVPPAVKHVMERVMDRSKANYVPVKTGALRDSGRVSEPYHETFTTTAVDAIYGNASVYYALEQHETPWYHHPVGQWKYLETPLLEATSTAAQEIADELAWR